MSDLFSGFSDIKDEENESDIFDGVTNTDITSELDVDLDSMTLDELYALRAELVDASDSSEDASDAWSGTPTHGLDWNNEQDTQDEPQRVLRK